ncbi:hypothetical protein L484_002859 [Morus notabilis]|uniref:Uncharacterized protein n=1 Tax=Morus notabilis TaxID=981085 RepID=W9RFJ6_9ROSA|nr:hypothetical protein L484_002859 [Morus notabilis]
MDSGLTCRHKLNPKSRIAFCFGLFSGAKLGPKYATCASKLESTQPIAFAKTSKLQPFTS